MLTSKTIKTLILFIVFASAMILNSCGKKTPEVVKIAVLEPFTGAEEVAGVQEYQGIALAHSMRGEVKGRLVELVPFDNKSDINETIARANEIVAEGDFVAVIGSWGSEYTIEAEKIFKEKQIPMIAPNETSVELTGEDAWCVRMSSDQMFQGKMLARYAVEKLGKSRAAILFDGESKSSLELAQYVGDAMINLTGDVGSIVYETSFSLSNSDYNSILTTIAKSEPDVIFLSAKYQDSAFIIKQAKAMGIDIPFIGSNVWDFDKFIELGGSSLNGSIFTTFFDANAVDDLSDSQKDFLSRYADLYKKKPVSATILGFDAYNMLLDSIEDVGLKKPKAIRQKMASWSAWEGMSGLVSTKPDGKTIRDLFFKSVQNSQFVHVNTVVVSHSEN